MRGKVTWGYVLAAHALIAVMLLHSDFLSRVRWHLGVAEEEAPLILTMRRVHVQMDPLVPAGSSIFLGDSLTMGLVASTIAPNAVNYGIGHQRSDQLLQSMDLYRSLATAGKVFVVIGTNDLLQGRDHGLEDRYRAILRKIPQSVPVVMADPPPSELIEPTRLTKAAAAARKACNADPRCKFVDLFGAMRGQPGVLQEDGVHLAPKGYSIMISQLRTAAEI